MTAETRTHKKVNIRLDDPTHLRACLGIFLVFFKLFSKLTLFIFLF